MSIYTDCSRSAKRLSQENKIFTEIDVVQSAAKRGWGKPQYKAAMREANQICSTLYREGRLIRYGPVKYAGQKDYARRASKIVYAGVEAGPEFWETPNGKFPQLKAADDPVGARPGRRAGSDRDDSKAWNEKEVAVTPAPRRSEKSSSAKQAMMQEIEDLKKEALEKSEEIEKRDLLIAELEARLREGVPSNGHSNGGLVTLPGDLSEEMIQRIAEAVMPDVKKAVSQEFKDKLAEALIS